EAMIPDVIVLRHSAAGAAHFLARHCRAAIVNAGDGAHEHPTQALLDALTLRQRKGRLKGLRVAIVGDILHSRVARSNLWLLSKMGAQAVLCGPPTLIPPGIEALAPVTHRIEEAIEGADAVMMLRLQLERMAGGFFPTIREYHARFGLTAERVKRAKKDVLILHPGPVNRGGELASEEAREGADAVMMLRLQLERMAGGFFPTIREYHARFGLTAERVKRAKKDVLILHPGPVNRGVEIASEVADGPYSVILDQVTNGVAVRMAVLLLLLGGGGEGGGWAGCATRGGRRWSRRT